ncbi:MAG: hypothetical protein IJ145_00260 [Prevotella sp.]|nr:hypothetical protein [Prevotella sp.]
MKAFFDKLYFGGYYMYLLTNHSAEYIIEKPLKIIFMLLGKISFIREFVETKKKKSYEQHIEDSFNYNRMFFDKDVCNFGHFQTGRLFGPMACGFWIDLAIIPFLIFERNILPYPFKGGNLIIFAAVFGIISFLLVMGGDERSERVVKEYRKKPQKEQRKAFYLFIGMYILVAIPIILLFFYAKRVGGW